MESKTPYQLFVSRCNALFTVSLSAKAFGQREKDAARELYTSANLACSVTEANRDFIKAYKALGAPGDFGYGTPVGHAMQAVYSAWTDACRAVRESGQPDVDRLAMGM